MTSTGNDIVALSAINVDRTRQPNFYSKIITDNEKSLYDEALFAVLPLEHFVWLAWSVKESVYKFLQRHQHDLIFSPSKIIIAQVTPPPKQSEAQREGIGFHEESVYRVQVTFIGHRFHARSILARDYIISVADNYDDYSKTHWGIKKIGSSEPQDQSAAVRELVLHKLNELFPDDHFKIEKRLAGFPVLLKNGTETAIPVSFAHHDQYVAYSFVLP
jgi:phosphopantetheinyl transferase (holo-ACP synthase)